MRKIDGKFHVEGSEIVKTSNGEAIPHDEPLFIIRGRDRLAIPLLKMYAVLSEIDGCNQYHFDKLNVALGEFENFSIVHADRMKQPSITMGK